MVMIKHVDKHSPLDKEYNHEKNRRFLFSEINK